MDAFQLFQTALSGLMNGSLANATASVAHNGTVAADQAPATQLAFNFSTLISLLLSLSTLREWVKLFVIGGVVETCRRSVMKLWSWSIESFWLTASFDENDASYNWIMFWLSRQPRWSKARVMDISTRSFGLNSPAITIAEDDKDDDRDDGRKLCYLPSFSRSYSLWYRGHYLDVVRSQSQDGIYRLKETLQINILARNHSVLKDLLLEAKKSYLAAEEHLISVYVSEIGGSWRHVTSRPKRPLKSIVLDPGMKDLLLDDAHDFLDSKQWYADRGIPFRRGYLLYGAPGSGKTSMIHSLAGELGLDVYIISLSRAGLDDTSLSALISELPERCIALMEDIDAAFHHGLTRDLEDAEGPSIGDDDEKKADHEREHEHEKAAVGSPLSRITLSGLLNALDGVGAQEGRILYATTNRYHALDPALCRPGRMDLHVEFKLASKYQARELFKCFYMPSPAEGEDVQNDQNAEAEKAEPKMPLEDKAGKVEKPKRESEEESGYGSQSSSPTASRSGDSDGESEESSAPVFIGNLHRKPHSALTRAEVLALSEKFASAIPEREFSMASLQGYLMSYKVRPVDAAECVGEWVEKQRAERTKKGKRRGHEE